MQTQWHAVRLLGPCSPLQFVGLTMCAYCLKHGVTMCHRVPSGPAPVLASDFRHSRSASQSVPQQTTQVNPAEPLCQSAPTADTHGQQPRECTAVAPLPQANRPAAAPVAPAQQPKQDTNSSAKASIIEAPTATGYAANASESCLLLAAYLRTSRHVALLHCLRQQLPSYQAC